MRRFYVCPRAVWAEHTNIAGTMMPRYNLFHKGVGSSFIDLDDTHILLCTDFSSEWAEDTWHAHQEVAHLPHPTIEGNVPLTHLHQKPEYKHKKFQPKHLAAIQKVVSVSATDTVWDLHDKLKAAGWPDMRLSNVF